MTVGEYIRRVSHREHLAWLRYLSESYNDPDRHDWYIMQLTAIVRGLFGRRSSIEDCKLKFNTTSQRSSTKGNTGSPSSSELLSEKLAWCGITGMSAKKLFEKKDNEETRSNE